MAAARSYHEARRTAAKVIGTALLLFALGLLASGCSVGGRGGFSGAPQGEYDPALKPSKGSKPYTIRGKTYYPLASGVGFSEEGIASWYGKDFHGKKTANGEIYDMYGMTAAHKLLPFNTQVKVTNLRNGKSIITRINDRGPFVEKRVIDLSYTGAKSLGMIGTGTAPVRIESIGAVDGISRGEREGTFEMRGTFYVQVGAFGNKQNAVRLTNRIKARGRSARYYYSDMVDFWRVQIGPYNTLNRAEDACDSLRGEYPGSFVVAP
ncbi:MAG: septal ring lytic transglycosylase RlpA family protein [Desulfovibrionaceae bacterium]|nr:septal ring lytic transglycosylase RlpA family protein [Desulfovibrionaceae bacterium]